MTSALNAPQTNTDGCLYRRDRIPTCTLSECLVRCPDYPARHVGECDRIPFHDPRSIPTERGPFIEWYREHARRFFEAPAASKLRASRQSPSTSAEAAEGTKQTGFDGLACSGIANYVKCVTDGIEWRPVASAIRAYGKESQRQLCLGSSPLSLVTRINDLPPVTCDMVLLKPKEALRPSQIPSVHWMGSRIPMYLWVMHTYESVAFASFNCPLFYSKHLLKLRPFNASFRSSTQNILLG